MNWITIKKFSELSGYSKKAVYNKVERRVWEEKIIWRKAPDGRIFINKDAFENWILGDPA